MRLRDSLRRSCHPLDSAGVIAVLGAVSAAIDGLSTCRRPLSRQLQPVEHAAFGFVALAAIGRRRWPEAVEHAPPTRPLPRGRLLAAAVLLRILALLARRTTLSPWPSTIGSPGLFRQAVLPRHTVPTVTGARVLLLG